MEPCSGASTHSPYLLAPILRRRIVSFARQVLLRGRENAMNKTVDAATRYEERADSQGGITTLGLHR